MDPKLRSDILDTLKRDFKAQERGTYLQKIECPSCHKREAFVETDAPWMVKCGRENKCGDQHHVKDLFPDFFNTWTERYSPKQGEPANPTAVADGYLRDGRGFDLMRIRGWYSQEYFQNHETNEGTTTVRFKLPNPNSYWERFLDKPQRFGKQKGRAFGEYKGLVWIPPMFSYADLAQQNEIHITEGIFDAIALLHAGYAAVSSISCSNYIDKFLAELAKHCAQGKRPTLIWGLDGDRAGRKYTLKHVNAARKAGWQATAMQCPTVKGRRFDWNDLYQRGELTDWHVEQYRYHGELLLAETAGEKALLMYHHRTRRTFWFEFDNNLFWWKLDIEAYDREVNRVADGSAENLSPEQRDQLLQSAGTVTRICTAMPRPLYYQANSITDESWYYFAVELPNGRTRKTTFTAKQLASSSEFKNRLLAIAENAWWLGTSKQLDQIMQQQMNHIKTVETIDYIGYSKDHEAWVWNDLAVKGGRSYGINSQDYFEFGKLSLKSLSSSVELTINPTLAEYNANWVHSVIGAFGSDGVIALAFWLGSLFAEQIRARQKSYPFMEIVGEAGAGKSTLIEFLWKLVGRADYEGFDPSKSTVAARARNFSQVSNLPVVLIESDREVESAKQKQFDWDELKTAFNGRSVRSRGVKNSGNDTYEPPFRGSFVIAQNAPVDAGEAMMSRIVHLFLTRETQTNDSKAHAEWLERVPMEQVSGFILQATRAEKQILAHLEQRCPIYEAGLMQKPEVRMVRIAKCHSQLMALVDCLGDDGLKLISGQQVDAARQSVEAMAAERQRSLNKDHPIVTEFWEAYEYIQMSCSENMLNHYGLDDQKIAINLKQFEKVCADMKLRTPDPRELKRFLKGSKSRKFKDSNHPVHSQLLGKTVKCWIFESR
ncbi:toprim domain-containing protein [Motiliproteus sp.]|uniref:toprim domain-containing protein n=1 Tax=Motiliproteus sp. TaxID=1898955 RepID=UPI003BAA9087